MAKTNIRSFRYSDEVAGIIEGFQGSNLNEKFENLVLYCFWNRKKLDMEIAQKQDKLCKLTKQIEDKKEELFDVQRLIDTNYGLSASITKVTIEVMDYLERLKNVTQNSDPASDLQPAECVTSKKGGKKVG